MQGSSSPQKKGATVAGQAFLSQNQSPSKGVSNFGGLAGLSLGGATSGFTGGLMTPQGSQNQKIQINYYDLVRKEQAKVIKALHYQMKQQLEQGSSHQTSSHIKLQNQNVQEDDDSENKQALKHPYIQTCIDKDSITKKYLVKTSQIPQASLKEFTHKDKNLISDLPDQSNFILFNGVELSLKKAFGQYQQPINKSIHFISNQTLIFFVGNYLALHNIVKDETRYIGIDANLAMITAFEVQTVEAHQKFDKINSSPTRQQAQQSGEQTLTTNQSPSKTGGLVNGFQLFSSDSNRPSTNALIKQGTGTYSQQVSNGFINNGTQQPPHTVASASTLNQINPNSSPSHLGINLVQTNSHTQQPSSQQQTAQSSSNAQLQAQQHHREMQTLIAYAERAKETHLKENRFQARKVYGIQNSRHKKMQGMSANYASKVSASSPINVGEYNRQSLVANQGFQQLASPTRNSPLKLADAFGRNNNESPLFNLEEVQNTKYLVKVNVFTLANPQKKYVLQHFFDEYFYVQQISIREKESLCYTLCTNQLGEQIFFIWNFRKEIVIGHVEMKSKINKFVVSPQKAELILFLGQFYLKYYEANFTNKIIKEQSTNIIPMKIEKESNFIDMEYINPKQQSSNSTLSQANGLTASNAGNANLSPGPGGSNANLGGSSNKIGVGDMFVLITDNTNSVYVFEQNQLKHKLTDQFKYPKVEQQVNEENDVNKSHDSVLSDSLEIGELSDREDIGRGEDHLKVRSQGTNPHKINPNANQRKSQSKKQGSQPVANINIQSFQQQLTNAAKKRQEDNISIRQGQDDLLRSPLSGQFKKSDDGENSGVLSGVQENQQQSQVVFQRVSVTQKGILIGCSNGFLVCYDFKNDFEPKLVNKVHISNKIKAIQSMSLSKGQHQNDDYLIAISGVYQKELKKAFRRGEGQEETNGLRTFSRKNSLNRVGYGDVGSHSLPPQRDFFMPSVIKNVDGRGGARRKQRNEKLSQAETLNQRASQGNGSKSVGPKASTLTGSYRGDDINVQNLFGPGDIIEKQEFLVVNMKAIQTQQQNKIVEKIFSKGAHDGSIFQLASCRNKSWLYSISESNTLKVWSHTNEWKGVSNFKLDEQPICIDIHPSSWQIALGFKSGIKIYQSLGKEIKLSFEKLGKAALSLAYADGGHLLACSNAVYVDIIDPIRMQLLVTLFGHKGLVRNLSWTLNSKYLISTCSNGGLFFWRGNFKEQTQKISNMPAQPSSEDYSSPNTSQPHTIAPIGQQNDKNYLYNQLAYDDELDVIIALTSNSTLRLLINHGSDAIHEEDLIGLGSLQNNGDSNLQGLQLANYNTQSNQFAAANLFSSVKATGMSFSKSLSLVAVSFSNGKVSVISWPIIPNLRTFKYDVLLQSNPLTDLRFSYASRYLLASSDDGNIYALETFKSTEGLERTWIHENQEKLTLQKKRETFGLTGFSVTDNIIMTNKEVLKNVNKKIDKLRMLKKSQEVNHEIKKRKTEKRYDKQMKLIGKELKEELEKQDRLMQATDEQFKQEKTHLQQILEEQMKEHSDERQVLVDGKEKNLNFVANENDELETRILRLKETIVDELERIEEEHQAAVNELVHTYEVSVRQAQEEVKLTIEKLRQNGSYYENMVKLQEKDYELEVSKLQSDLIEDHTEFVNRKRKLENEDEKLKEEYQQLEAFYKEKNNQRKEKQSKVHDLQNEYKSMFSNLERLGEKNLQSNVFIEEKERTALETIGQKRQLENVIAFLAEKIKELKNQRMPLERRKQELENMIQDTYRELQDDFQFRKYLQLKHEALEKKMDILKKEIAEKDNLKEAIEGKNYIFKRELCYLAEAQSLRGWTHKMQGMLKCMSEVYNAASAEQVKKISTAFIHIAEIMESNARPYRPSQHEEDNFVKQSKLNEMELAYYRNKNSQKMEEMQIRFKGLFSQLEKAVKKLRNDNIKLIEEFNTLINEKKKLNNLRRMITESIKELMGDKYDADKYGSSEEDTFKPNGGAKKKKKFNRQRSQEDLSASQIVGADHAYRNNRNSGATTQRNNQDDQAMSGTKKKENQYWQSGMNRSKSQSSFAMKHAKILQNIHNQVNKDYLFGSLADSNQTINDIPAAQVADQHQLSTQGNQVLGQTLGQEGSQYFQPNADSITLPSLRQKKIIVKPKVSQEQQALQMNQISLGASLTARERQTSEEINQKRGQMAGFSLNKTQQLMNKRRFINSVTANSQSSQIAGFSAGGLESSVISQGGNNVTNKYLERIVDEFEKNKRQIEEQTKTLKQIQNLAHVISESQSPSNEAATGVGQPTNQQTQVQLAIGTFNSNQQGRQVGAAPAVPSLNLRKMLLKNEPLNPAQIQQLNQQNGSLTQRLVLTHKSQQPQPPQQVTVTTRVHVSTERTQSVISNFNNQKQGGLNFSQSLIGPAGGSNFNATGRSLAVSGSTKQLPTVKERQSSMYQTKEGGAKSGVRSGLGSQSNQSAFASGAQTARDNISSREL